jgi:hypothetical protein
MHSKESAVSVQFGRSPVGERSRLIGGNEGRNAHKFSLFRGKHEE